MANERERQDGPAEAKDSNPAALRASSHDGAPPPADAADAVDRTGRDEAVVGIDVRDDERAMDGLRRVGAALTPDSDPEDPAGEAASLGGPA